MAEIQDQLTTALNGASKRLREADLPDELADEMKRLAGQVRKHCVVAVVGQVKVGKSTFVNALLGGDLAKVGTTETTATINYFSHGEPADPDKPVRCHWRGGKTTYEDRAFLDSLQGNDMETLRRADGIDYLEYFLKHPFLEQATLVDTPGTNAVLAKHQDRTAEYMRLYNQLRERHNKDTERLGERADAIIYLTGEVAMASEQSFLREFREMTGSRSRALNAVGVLSKIELQPEVLERREELSATIARQLKDELNTVVPVGAGVKRALDQIGRDGLARLTDTLRRIPQKRLRRLLMISESYMKVEYEDCPVNVPERQALIGEMPWAVFTTIARVAGDPELSPEEVAKRLEEISNFGPLKELLSRHFFERGHILRCYATVNDALRILSDIKFTHLPQRRKEIHQERDRLERFVSLIRQAGGDSKTRSELEDFVYRYLDVNARVTELEELHAELSEEFDGLYHQLMQYNADFDALQRLEKSDHRFSDVELEELRPLLGMSGSELEKRLPPGKEDTGYAVERMLYWSGKMEQAPFGSARQIVAEQARKRYGIIYEELDGRASSDAATDVGTSRKRNGGG